MNWCILLLMFAFSKSDILKCLSEVSKTYTESIVCSGKNLNDLGNMQECQNNP